MELGKFENYCGKCGADKPDCDMAFNAIYEAIKQGEHDEIVSQGLDAIMSACGDKKCGTAIHDYIQLKRYDDGTR